MKRIFIFISAIVISSSVQSQVCIRTVSSFIKASGGYDINGSAILELQQDSTLLLTFDSDFSTTQGPDLYVFLAKENKAPTLQPGKLKYRIAPLQNNSGTQSYTIPDSISIDEYDWVLIHCVNQNHFWGGGMLGALNGCPSSSVDQLESCSGFSIFPNPSSGIFQFQNITINKFITVKVFDLLGKEVFIQIFKPSLSNTINLSFLPEGLYLLELNDGKGEAVKKIFILHK